MGLSNTQKGILFAFVGFSFFTLSDALIKVLGNHYEAYAISFWNYIVVLILSLIFSLIGGIKKSLKTQTPFIHIARSLCMVFVSVFSVVALSEGLPMPTLYTIAFLGPMLVTIAAIPIYKERVSRQSWAVILLGFAGIAVAFLKDATFLTPPVIYAFLMLFFGISTSLLSRPISKSDHILTIPFYTALVIVLSLFAYMRGNIPIPSMEHAPIFAIGGSFLFIGVTGVMHAFRIGRYASAASMQYTQMVSALLISYYVFNDVPNMWMLVGAGMIIASGLLLIAQEKFKTK